MKNIKPVLALSVFLLNAFAFTGCGNDNTTLSSTINSKVTREVTGEVTVQEETTLAAETTIVSETTTVSGTEATTEVTTVSETTAEVTEKEAEIISYPIDISSDTIDGLKLVDGCDSKLYKEEDGSFTWVHKGAVTMKIPAECEGKFIIRSEGLYSKKCWQDRNYSGKIISIIIRNNIDDWNMPGLFLGFTEGNCVYSVNRTDLNFDYENEELRNEVASLDSAREQIIESASCSVSGSKYVYYNMFDYKLAPFAENNFFEGKYKIMSSSDKSNNVTFNEDGSLIVNTSDGNQYTGFYVLEEDDRNYGLALFNNEVHKLSGYFSAAPLMINLDDMSDYGDAGQDSWTLVAYDYDF